MTVGSGIQMFTYLNSKMRIILCDNRTFIGKFASYDKFMNIVLTDTIEVKKYKPRRKDMVEGKKEIGVAIFRGENIMSIIVDKVEPQSSSYSGNSGRYSGSSGSSRSRY